MNKIRKTSVLLSVLVLCGCVSCNRPVSMGLGECVVLLHGLNRSSLSMEIMEYELTERGFLVANIDYPSTERSRQNSMDGLAIRDSS